MGQSSRSRAPLLLDPSAKPTSVCEDGSGPLVPVLALAWDVERGQLAQRVDRGAKLRVTNQHPHAVAGTVEVKLAAGNRKTSLEPRKFRLAPGQSRSFDVEPQHQPWNWPELRSSGTIEAKVVVRGTRRTPTRTLRAPFLFFHREEAAMLFYSADLLVDRFRGGDYVGQRPSTHDRGGDVLYQHVGTGFPIAYEPLDDGKPDDFRPAPLPDRFIPHGQTTSSPFVPEGLGGVGDYRKVCLWLDTDFEDENVGDYLTDDEHRAFGARYHLGIPWVGTYTGYDLRRR